MARRYSFLGVVIMLSFGLVVFAQQTKIKKVPAPYTAASSGQEMYQAYCGSCHGKDAKGDGPAAPALKASPTNLTTLAKRNGGKFPNAHVTTVIRGDAALAAHGSKDMPVWGPIFRAISGGSQAEVQMRISNLAKYLESVQEK